ncbi:coenzyme F420-0:L-glutamate ligase [Alloiococcus sp. CFN-8]|uniref:coenzyme F420-0:L-glutamate ligase n=1 Tax=Alloiococcus sp. CFN-8 TaxID=3416081 RepID=UPI003CF74B9C
MSGVISRGIKAPIIRKGDDLVEIVVENVLAASKEDNFSVKDKDVIAITESIVARSQGNYIHVDDIAEDIKAKYNKGETLASIGVVFPILSRNRFAMCLRGIARSAKEVIMVFSFPKDEVGNPIMDKKLLWNYPEENFYTNYYDVNLFEEMFGKYKHPFTGMDYVDYYRSIIEGEGARAKVVYSNNPASILKFTANILCSDIHTRMDTKYAIELKSKEAKVLTLCDIMNESISGSGYHPEYGLLGSNKATETTLKLFPRDAQDLVEAVQKEMFNRTGKTLEVMIYGDGAFKDPVGGIWELADPVVSPNYTSGLKGTPNELKLKYLADDKFANINGEELKTAIEEEIKNKEKDLIGNMASEGTTPRKYVDLLGSLADLTSGSGDKGTPIILIQNYFSNYAD